MWKGICFWGLWGSVLLGICMFLVLPFTPSKADWPFYGVGICLIVNLLLTMTALYIHDRSEQAPIILDGAVSGNHNPEPADDIHTSEDGSECMDDRDGETPESPDAPE